MLKRLLTPIFHRFARSLGILDLQIRVDELEAQQRLNSVSDDTYAAIEARFRGSPEAIKERQRQYLPFITRIVNEEAPLLDIGCGRGEWLSLLRESGIPSQGIDTNRTFVEQAQQLGLAVSFGDITSVLEMTDANSLGAVTMFQVAEHLPLRILENVLIHIHRSLRVGGVAIIEIPNIETSRVGASTFWIDPTHIRPLFPDFLVFLAERAGFNSVQTVASTPLDDSLNVDGDDTLSTMVQTLWNRVNGPGDFAIVAHK